MEEIKLFLEWLKRKGYCIMEVKQTQDVNREAIVSVLTTELIQKYREDHEYIIGVDMAKGESKSIYSFDLSLPEGVPYTEHLKTFGFWLHMLQNQVWERTALGRPDTLVIAPDVWPVVDAQDGFEKAEGIPEVPADSELPVKVGRLTRHGMDVHVHLGTKAGTGQLSCSKLDEWKIEGEEEREEFRIYFSVIDTTKKG